MIALKELNPRDYPTNPEIDANLLILLEKLNKIRVVWGKPMTITSGLRNQAQQDALISIGKSTASKSKHLYGQAADISDPNGDLKAFIMANISLIEEIGLWCEDFDHTPTWIHFQIVSPKSSKRFFIP